MKKESKKMPKWLIVLLSLVVIVFVGVKLGTWLKNTNTPEDYSEEWAELSYEGRQEFLEGAIKNKSFVNASEAERAIKEAISEKSQNPQTISYQWSPSVYSDLTYVLEADSGWMFTPYRLTAKNDFGIKKEIAGSITFKYNPETHSISVHKWEINEN